jgi:exoribonuclease R
MKELAMKLREARMRRGVDFDFEESRSLLMSSKAIDIVKRERSLQNKLLRIMLAANETVDISMAGVPFLYRIHEDPDQRNANHGVCRQFGHRQRPAIDTSTCVQDA